MQEGATSSRFMPPKTLSRFSVATNGPTQVTSWRCIPTAGIARWSLCACVRYGDATVAGAHPQDAEGPTKARASPWPWPWLSGSNMQMQFFAVTFFDVTFCNIDSVANGGGERQLCFCEMH